MRSVSLSNSVVQNKIRESFIPLKLEIEYGTEKFPLKWPALKNWRNAYLFMGGKKVKGITGCCVVTPDQEIILGHTGSAYVWELFESVAYDATKFATMLDNSLIHFQKYEVIVNDPQLGKWKRKRLLRKLKADVKKSSQRSLWSHLPPKGFSVKNAKELFILSGDLKEKN